MKRDDDYDMNFKLIIVGDSSVGKSNMGNRYINNDFQLETKTTVGVEFFIKKLVINKKNIRAHIWDTAGQEKFKSITKSYYKGAKGALVVYDISRRESFDNVDKWISELKSNGDTDLIITLIGNKCDLENLRKVNKEEATEKAKLYSIKFFCLFNLFFK
jgi:Ras-related protein Rab-11A